MRDSFKKNTAKLGLDGILSSADVIVVGFSGGADSTSLLYLLKEYCANAEIHALHVNHMIRGENADRDEKHCREFCEKAEVPFISRRVDVPAIAKEEKLGIEEAARKARYSAFDEYLSELETNKKVAVLATAHNADDNLETIIFNLIRGSGSRGLSGIAPIRGKYVRPLLCYTSAEIREFCSANGLVYVTDETNADTAYSRNLLRAEVLPHLRKLSPSCAQAALSASKLVRRDDEYLESIALSVIGEDAISANVDILRGLDDCILSRALLRMYTNARGGRKNFGRVHLDTCINLVRSSDRGELYLPGRILMKLDGKRVAFTVFEEKLPPFPFERTLISADEDITGMIRYFDFPDGRFCVALSDSRLPEPENPSNGENIYKISIHTTISFDKIVGSIFVRNRLAGDTFVMGGMTRRVKKLLSAAQIEDRDSLPFFCDGDGIFYIPLIGSCDRMKDGGGDLRISFWR